jgi:flagellar biosynthesis protein FlhG
VAGLADLGEAAIAFLGQQLAGLGDLFDVVVIDTGAGISAQVVGFLKMAHEIITVVTPNIAATLDAYGLIKIVREAALPGRLQIVVNQADDDAQAEAVYERLRGCADRFLGFSPAILGSLRRDKSIEEANQNRRPLVAAKPKSKNAREVVAMARRLMQTEPIEVVRRLNDLTSLAISRVHESTPAKSYESPPNRNLICQ